jgi:hypothetical protein
VGFTAGVIITPEGGFYGSDFTINILPEFRNDPIHYTFDGSEPDEEDPLFIVPLLISPSDFPAVLRARTINENRWPGPISTVTYLDEPSFAYTTLSIVADPDDLWDEEQGILIEENLDADLERPVHLEFWESDGTLGFGIDVGLKIHGTSSASLNQPPLRVMMRGSYGESILSYPVFEESRISDFNRLLLRNAGNDYMQGHMRDPFIHSISEPSSLDLQRWRPALVYLNGEPWGMYHIREQINDYHIASYRGLNAENIEIIVVPLPRDETEHDYNLLLDFAEENDLSIPANYAVVEEQVDLENFARYQAVEIFFANYNWWRHNVELWRSIELDNRWRWILTDLDVSSGICHIDNCSAVAGDDMAFLISGRPADDAHALALDPIGVDDKNPLWSTVLFRKLVENNSFLTLYVNTIADYMNTFLGENDLVTAFNETVERLTPLMPVQCELWGSSMDMWADELEFLRGWFLYRADFVRENIQTHFGLSGTYQIELMAFPPEAGVFQLTAITVEHPFTGTYFQGVPVSVTAVPQPGWLFQSWSGDVTSNEPALSLLPTADVRLGASFIELERPVVINEIAYHSAEDSDTGDWLELYNPSADEVDISGWVLEDGDENQFVVPEGVTLLGEGFTVLCSDCEALSILAGDVQVAGEIEFNFSNNGEALFLFDRDGEPVDRVEYSDDAPWPEEADGDGPTLELIDPFADNAIPGNWAASIESTGTPGMENSMFW